MKNEKQSLVFFGSGPVAAESLRLLSSNFTVEAIITKPTTKNEMQTILPNTPLFTVSNKTGLDLLISEHNFSSILAVLIDFGIIVSQKVIDNFKLGIINSHFSLLPELRGADPISFAILEGKEKTGVSLMLLVEEMDEGPILAIGEEDLDQTETTPLLTNRLIKLSNVLLSEVIPVYYSGKSIPIDQDILSKKMGTKPSYTRKLTKADGIIDWGKPAVQIEREIRGYYGWPSSKTNLNGIDISITEATVIDSSGNAGELFIYDKKLAIYCGDEALIIEKLKPAGKKEMDSISFLAGYKERLDL